MKYRLLWLVGALVLAGCSEQQLPNEPIRPLRVLTVDAGGTALAAARTYSGEVRSRYETPLAFRVGGKLAERLANVGDRVVAGQVLARLDPEDVKLQSAQADAQRTLAWQEVQRYRDLFARKFVSKAALDAREATFKAADAQAALARNQSEYAVLRADKPSLIGQVLADPGQVVAAGQAVFRLAPDGDREILLAIPETELPRFKVGQPARITLFALGESPLAGAVREVSPVADPATRTYPVRISLTGNQKIALGLSATVRLDDEAPALAGVIAIPQTAVFQKEGKAAVWLLDADDSVRLHPVTIVEFRDEQVLISDGLKGGERIAVAGVHRLQAGQRVRPVAVPSVARAAQS